VFDSWKSEQPLEELLRGRWDSIRLCDYCSGRLGVFVDWTWGIGCVVLVFHEFVTGLVPDLYISSFIHTNPTGAQEISRGAAEASMAFLFSSLSMVVYSSYQRPGMQC
jgi:hypothetical protein